MIKARASGSLIRISLLLPLVELERRVSSTLPRFQAVLNEFAQGISLAAEFFDKRINVEVTMVDGTPQPMCRVRFLIRDGKRPSYCGSWVMSSKVG